MNSFLRRLLFLIVLGALGASVIRIYVFEGIYIASGSMEPTLPKGRHLIVNKLSMRFRAPKRGEIVVFKTPQGPDKDLVKRVIAVAGDVIRIDKKSVYLNNKPLSEPYVQHTRPLEILEGDNLSAIQIPEGHVFVMGDNRDESKDSRDWRSPKDGAWSPYVPVKAVKGVVIGAP